MWKNMKTNQYSSTSLQHNPIGICRTTIDGRSIADYRSLSLAVLYCETAYLCNKEKPEVEPEIFVWGPPYTH